MRVHVHKALNLSYDALIFCPLPSSVRGGPTCVVHQHPIPARSQLSHVDKVLVGTFCGVIAIDADNVALDVWAQAMELWNRVARWSQDEIKTIWEHLLHELNVANCVFELCNIEGIQVRLGISVHVYCGRMPCVEAYFANVFHSRPSGDMEIHIECLVA